MFCIRGHVRVTRERRNLQNPNCHTKRDPCASQRPFIISNGPWILHQRLESARQMEFGFRYRRYKARSRTRLTGSIERYMRANADTEDILDLLGIVLL